MINSSFFSHSNHSEKSNQLNRCVEVDDSGQFRCPNFDSGTSDHLQLEKINDIVIHFYNYRRPQERSPIDAHRFLYRLLYFRNFSL